MIVPNKNYICFEDEITPILKEIHKNQKKNQKIISSYELVWKIGEKVNHKESVNYWAFKNKIPVFCTAITDGAVGDIVFFNNYKLEDLKIDVSKDHFLINDMSNDSDITCGIFLGGGMVKSYVLNANKRRGGLDYSLMINIGNSFDGSETGKNP